MKLFIEFAKIEKSCFKCKHLCVHCNRIDWFLVKKIQMSSTNWKSSNRWHFWPILKFISKWWWYTNTQTRNPHHKPRFNSIRVFSPLFLVPFSQCNTSNQSIIYVNFHLQPLNKTKQKKGECLTNSSTTLWLW